MCLARLLLRAARYAQTVHAYIGLTLVCVRMCRVRYPLCCVVYEQTVHMCIAFCFPAGVVAGAALFFVIG